MATGPKAFETLKILIIEDKEHMRALLRRLLNHIGVRTTHEAPDGTATSQPRTGNAAGLTFSSFAPGTDRVLIGIGVPSKTTDGQASWVTTRTLEDSSGPSSTHRARILPWHSPTKEALATQAPTSAVPMMRPAPP